VAKFLAKMLTLRFFVNDKRISTAVTLNDGTCLQVYPDKKKYINENAWRVSWESSSAAKPSIRVEEEDDNVRNLKKDWICPACGKGPGNDHRMCICLAFDYNVQNWEIACGIRKYVRSPSPPPAPSPSPIISSHSLSAACNHSLSAACNQIPITSSVNLSDWQYSSVMKYTFPAGTYYIGDLCYVLGDDVYDKVYGGYDYRDGVYAKKGTSEIFMVGGTACGDGFYEGSDENGFAVDAGIIGITPSSCIRKNNGGGHTYTFSEPVKCTFKSGIFEFVSGDTTLTIDTERNVSDEESEGNSSEEE
jgi:hypothetical protein